MRSGLGDRFTYVTGASGRRYLFTAINRDELADFVAAVVVFARRETGGLRVLSVAEVDPAGAPAPGRFPPVGTRDCRVLVHLLAERSEDRRAVVADLIAACRPS